MTCKLPKTLYLFVAAACVALRLYLKLKGIDPETGFYLAGAGMAAAVYSWILGLGIAALLFLGWRSSSRLTGVVRFVPSVCGSSALAGIFALLCAVDAVPARLDSLLDADFNVSVPALLLSAAGILLGFVLLVLLPAVTGVLLLWSGMRLRGGDSSAPRVSGWLALLPMLWQVALLLTTFMEYTAIGSVSDQMVAIVAMLLICPFLLAWARVLAGVGHDRGIRQLIIFGLPFSAAALSVSAGVLLSWTVKTPVEIAMGIPAAGFYLSMGLYAAALCFTMGEKNGPV